MVTLPEVLKIFVNSSIFKFQFVYKLKTQIINCSRNSEWCSRNVGLCPRLMGSSILTASFHRHVSNDVPSVSGHDVFDSSNVGSSLKKDVSGMSPLQQQNYRSGVFHLLVLMPIVCATLQLLAWSRFKLKGERLRSVKSIRKGAAYLAV